MMEIYQTERACVHCAYCQPEDLAGFPCFELAACKKPVNLVSHHKAYDNSRLCYLERHFGFCKDGQYFEMAASPPR